MRSSRGANARASAQIEELRRKLEEENEIF
jgi:hypothetical protein